MGLRATATLRSTLSRRHRNCGEYLELRPNTVRCARRSIDIHAADNAGSEHHAHCIHRHKFERYHRARADRLFQQQVHPANETNCHQHRVTDNSGTIVAIGSSATAISNPPFGGFYTNSLVDNTATGTIMVTAEAAQQTDFIGAGSLNVSNAGLIQVVSIGGSATGVETFNPIDFQFVNASTGTLTVWAGSAAAGVVLDNGGSFNNAGTINVTGYSAVGVVTPSSFDNSGTITAFDTSGDGNSIGVYVGSATSYVNTGTIQADYSFYVDPNYRSPEFAPSFSITNTGLMIGAVQAGDGNVQINNGGTIHGTIYFGDGNDTYSGASGNQTGGIYLGSGLYSIDLGNDGENVFGGSSSATITGGSGNDFIELERGDNTIDGGGGFNTLSFADSDASVDVNLATGTATAGGTDTIENIQCVIASGYSSTLQAGVSAVTFIGGAGSDTLIGGAGNDTLVAGTSGTTMTGAGGDNTFVYSAGDGQLVITDFDAGGDRDTLKIYGYSAARSVTQQGSNTLITLSNSDTIVLDNVRASSLSGIIYSTSAYPLPQSPEPAPAVFGTSTIDITHNMTINADENININAQNQLAGLFVSGLDFTNLSAVDNFASVRVSNADYGVFFDSTLFSSTSNLFHE